MAGIRYLKHEAIDHAAWNRCISNSLNPQVYGYSWYLEAITAGQWDALVFGDYEAVFPLAWRRKFGLKVVYQPFFCQQLGLFAPEGFTGKQADFLKAIPKQFVKVYLQLRPQVETGLPLEVKPNFILSLNAPYDTLKQGYNSDARKNLKSGLSDELTITYIDSPQPVIELYKEVWGPLNPHVSELHYDRFAAACIEAQKHDAILCVEARNNGTLLGRAIFLKSPSFLHYVCAAPTDEGKKSGVMHHIIDFIIKEYSGQALFLDFEGSAIPSVARFYQKFNPINLPYSIYSAVRLF